MTNGVVGKPPRPPLTPAVEAGDVLDVIARCAPLHRCAPPFVVQVRPPDSRDWGRRYSPVVDWFHARQQWRCECGRLHTLGSDGRWSR